MSIKLLMKHICIKGLVEEYVSLNIFSERFGLSGTISSINLINKYDKRLEIKSFFVTLNNSLEELKSSVAILSVKK